MPTSKKRNVASLKKAFLEAAKTGNEIIVKELLNLGPSKDLLHLDFKEGNKDTPLHFACENGHVDVVELIMKNSINFNNDLNAKCIYGETAFHAICRNGKSDIAEMIMKNSFDLNIDLNAKGDDGTGFHVAL